MPKTPLAVLQETFGFAAFRPGQAEVVAAQVEGRDVLSVAPTGSGKSISYWVPAVVAGGLTVVVSPLIALMKDQVDRLNSHEIPAGFVNSSIDRALQERRLEEAEAGLLRLLYVAPERLARPGFLDRMARLRITRLIVDEAHCISSWGHDFRPDYRILGDAVRACGQPPVAAFTATATPRVRDDIVANLGLRTPLRFVGGFRRSNLFLEAQRCRGEKEKRERVQRALRDVPGRALVYTGTRGDAEELAALFPDAAAYHAGLADAERRRVQDGFASGDIRVVVATNAFGMGIDVAAVRQVIHHHLPGSVEAYYQEAGRGGRDGDPARCLLLWSPADRSLHAHFIERGDVPQDPTFRDGAYARLAQMFTYARATSCRHTRIAEYFGDTASVDACVTCDNCRNPAAATRAVDDADVVTAMAAVQRFSGHIGAANLAAILAGRDTAWTRSRAWVRELAHFGALRWADADLRSLFSEFTDADLMRQSHGEYPVVEITQRGLHVLAGREQAEISLPIDTPAEVVGRKERPSVAIPATGDGTLVDKLRTWRRLRAEADGVPAFVVFHDRVLLELAARQPASLGALSTVSGVGPAKLERYGPELLELLAGGEEAD